MSNIVVGGYGTGQGSCDYADIVWSKKQHKLVFKIDNTYNLIFDIKTVPIKFNIDTNKLTFDFKKYQKIFDIKFFNLKFKVSRC